jgi:hypothetical protein
LEPTEKQAAVLEKYKIPVPETRGEAADILSRLFALKKRRA